MGKTCNEELNCIYYDRIIECHRKCCKFYEATWNKRLCRFNLGEKLCNDNCAYMKQFIKLIKSK